MLLLWCILWSRGNVFLSCSTIRYPHIFNCTWLNLTCNYSLIIAAWVEVSFASVFPVTGNRPVRERSGRRGHRKGAAPHAAPLLPLRSQTVHALCTRLHPAPAYISAGSTTTVFIADKWNSSLLLHANCYERDTFLMFASQSTTLYTGG